MQYSTLVRETLLIILKPFEKNLSPSYLQDLGIDKIAPSVSINQTLYMEILTLNTDGEQLKIEQWKFKPTKEEQESHLEKSFQQQESDNDSDLSFGDLNYEGSYFETLKTIRGNTFPRTLFSGHPNYKVIYKLGSSEAKLIDFKDPDSTYYSIVAEYQSADYDVKLSIKYNYSDQTAEVEDLKQKSNDSDQFQLLIDESYERQFQTEKNLRSSPRKISRLTAKDEVIEKEQPEVRSTPKKQKLQNLHQKSQQQNLVLKQLKELMNRIDFDGIKSSSKLEAFKELLI